MWAETWAQGTWHEAQKGAHPLSLSFSFGKPEALGDQHLLLLGVLK